VRCAQKSDSRSSQKMAPEKHLLHVQRGLQCPPEFAVDEEERGSYEVACATHLSTVLAPLEASLRKIEVDVAKCSDALLGNDSPSLPVITEMPAKDAGSSRWGNHHAGTRSSLECKLEQKCPADHRDTVMKTFSSNAERQQLETPPSQVELKLVEDEHKLRRGRTQHDFAMRIEHGSVTRRWVYRRCSGLIDWWYALKEPERTGVMAGIVESDLFQAICSTVILVNCAFAAHNINHEMANLSSTATSFAKMS